MKINKKNLIRIVIIALLLALVTFLSKYINSEIFNYNFL